MKYPTQLHKKRVIILATEGQTTNLLYNNLVKHYNVETVIIEEKISSKLILKNRIKNLGLFKTFGQLVFVVFVPRILRIFSKKRIQQIIENYSQNDKPIPSNKITPITSINDKLTIQIVQDSSPELIFVNGTRIINKKIIETINIPMLNIHVGITPKYRGVHGGYWALYNNDLKNFGTTIHYIDSGIDTGRIITQETTNITQYDNFTTYPLIQYCLGLKTLSNELLKSNQNNNKLKNSKTPDSKLHYHPTITQYLYKRIFKGIK